MLPWARRDAEKQRSLSLSGSGNAGFAWPFVPEECGLNAWVAPDTMNFWPGAEYRFLDVAAPERTASTTRSAQKDAGSQLLAVVHCCQMQGANLFVDRSTASVAGRIPGVHPRCAAVTVPGVTVDNPDGIRDRERALRSRSGSTTREAASAPHSAAYFDVDAKGSHIFVMHGHSTLCRSGPLYASQSSSWMPGGANADLRRSHAGWASPKPKALLRLVVRQEKRRG